jgi:putative tryptophan/tyrosine transport system substrate-binding protein
VNFDPTFFSHLKRMANAARQRRLPMASNDFGDLTRAGGLFSYSPDGDEITTRVAEYVDRLLRGAKPTETPVAQPTRYRFILNVQTASAIGLTIPASHLVSADEVVR